MKKLDPLAEAIPLYALSPAETPVWNLADIHMDKTEFWRCIELLRRGSLSPQESQVLLLRFYPQYEMSINETAAKIHLCRSRVQQIEASARRKLKRALRPPKPIGPNPSETELPYVEAIAKANFKQSFQRCTTAAQCAILNFARNDYWVQLAMSRGAPKPKEIC